MAFPISSTSFEFCIPPNRTISMLRRHAEVNLQKLRSGRNIAGIVREVPAYAAATDTVTGMPVVINGQTSLPGVRAPRPMGYRYTVLIARAKAMAKVAQAQLAFERQEVPAATIRMDYWVSPTSNPMAALGAKADDRQGLTGSARLLADIYQLEQYAFDTNKRKLAMTKTLSLAQMAPAEFQRFREIGVMLFNTPMQIFDRDFPGHYLRLIKRVRTSVIALIPTTEGIHATLASTGISRVVIGPDVFQAVTIRRDPGTIALTAPIGSTGVFEMESSEMYLPFEGGGVDGAWELRMPKASNRFDFRSIADVLISIDYAALNNFDYRQLMIQELDPKLRADRAFSFRNHFPDAWYDLHNPQLVADPKRMVVRVPIRRADFPSNLDRIRTQHVTLAVARGPGLEKEIRIEHLKLTAADGTQVAGGAATTIDGAVSTRRGNGSTWLPHVGAGGGGGGQAPFGTWRSAFETPTLRKRSNYPTGCGTASSKTCFSSSATLPRHPPGRHECDAGRVRRLQVAVSRFGSHVWS